MDVSIIITTLNEAPNLPLVLPRIPNLPEIKEVLLLDGHSTDGTAEVAKELMPDIKVVLQDGKGKGNAIVCGARIAAGEYFLILDADTSHRPEEIPLYIDKAKDGYHLIKGSRYLTGGSTEDASFFRNLIVRTANAVANLAWRTHFSDICYGMFMIQRDSFLSLDIQSQGWDVEWEMMVKAAKHKLRITEVPSQENARHWGESHLPNYFSNGAVIARRVFSEARLFRNNDD